MKREYKNIERYFDVVIRALFGSTSKLSYQRTLECIDKLAVQVHNTDTDETVWYIGENCNASLDAVIVGAYWFLADHHGGQNSLEYQVLSSLSEIYNPGMTSHPEPESTERDVYEMFERLYNVIKENQTAEKCYS